MSGIGIYPALTCAAKRFAMAIQRNATPQRCCRCGMIRYVLSEGELSANGFMVAAAGGMPCTRSTAGGTPVHALLAIDCEMCVTKNGAAAHRTEHRAPLP